MFEKRHHVPHFWVHVVVFVLSVIAVIFLMYNNRPICIGIEDSNDVKIVERKK